MGIGLFKRIEESALSGEQNTMTSITD